MAHPVPPEVQAAHEQLKQAALAVEKRDVDFAHAPWPELEKTVIKLLGGPFHIDKPDHQVVALGLAAALADRLNAEHGAFWFFDRDAPEGASLGFPSALIMLSPLGAVLDALGHSSLARLDDSTAEIRRALAQTKFSLTAKASPVRLLPEDYQRLFDAGFVQFLAVDLPKAKEAWGWPPERLSREIRDALGRSTRIQQELRTQLESQLVGALDRLERGKPLIDQVDRASRVAELMVHLFATKAATGFAPEELWHEIVFPLLFVSAPDKFPPLEVQDLDAYREGADAVALFVDIVPYTTPAAEDGLLGVFPVDQLGLADEKFRSAATRARLVKVGKEPLRKALEAFDPAKTKDALQRFVDYVEEKAGLKRGGEPSPLLEASLQLLGELKRAAMDPSNGGCELFMRRCTEAEAASESALELVREALKAPRIILA
jgi:hypothetical protein